MKLYKFSLLMLGAALFTTACDDIDEQIPEGGSITREQYQETVNAIPERAEASFNGMFDMMGRPHTCWPTGGNSSRADDFGFITIAFSSDMEGADIFMVDNGYNWFSTCSALSSRNANYANPYMRYRIPYNQIGMANEVIGTYAEDTTDSLQVNRLAQARAIRAFDYMNLAPYFAFGVNVDPTALCVPILLPGVDYTNNPRATVKEVWDFIISELDYAVDHLEFGERTAKSRIDKNVALALRARANLIAGNYAAAVADADAAMTGYTPATIDEVSHPAFCDINEHNWIWGINVTTEMSGDDMATASSWLGSFSGSAYSTYINPPFISILLYNKISDTDVRKGWWLDTDCQSPLLNGLTWTDQETGATASGQEIATFEINDVKCAYEPYTSVKFGQKSGIGSITNNNDFPLIRVEEMYLIKAEALARQGNETEAGKVLEDFVKTYRDPSFTLDQHSLGLLDEIWFQRRVELWCEGFFTMDAKRMGKPIVRVNPKGTNFPEAFRFNIAADDPWLNMRFPSTELDNNYGCVDNSGGQVPVTDQNADLLDGVTD